MIVQKTVDRKPPVRWSLSYAQAEATLAWLHGIKGDVQKNAFRGRLKHLKRLGIPRGINPGSGAKIYYFEEQLYEWAFCLELAEFGLDPTVVVDLMSAKWDDDILPKLLLARGDRDPNDHFFAADPAILSASLIASKQALPFRWIEAKQVQRYVRQHRRLLLFNVSELCRQIAMAGQDHYSKRVAAEAAGREEET